MERIRTASRSASGPIAVRRLEHDQEAVDAGWRRYQAKSWRSMGVCETKKGRLALISPPSLRRRHAVAHCPALSHESRASRANKTTRQREIGFWAAANKWHAPAANRAAVPNQEPAKMYQPLHHVAWRPSHCGTVTKLRPFEGDNRPSPSKERGSVIGAQGREAVFGGLLRASSKLAAVLLCRLLFPTHRCPYGIIPHSSIVCLLSCALPEMMEPCLLISGLG